MTKAVAHHTYVTRVYYADTDAGGVVYHAAYLALAERARTEALHDAGLPHEAMRRVHDCIFMVRRADLEYLRPARLDDMLTITTEKLAESAATVTLLQAFSLADGSCVVRATITLACVRATTGRPARIPAPWRHLPY